MPEIMSKFSQLMEDSLCESMDAHIIDQNQGLLIQTQTLSCSAICSAAATLKMAQGENELLQDTVIKYQNMVKRYTKLRDIAKEELKNALRELYYKDLELQQIKKEKEVQKKRFREVKKEFTD